MKSSALFILISFTIASTSVYANGTGEPKSHQIIDSIYDAFVEFKQNNQQATIAKLEALDFKVSKSSSTSIPKQAILDSLVLANNTKERWAYFRSLDLGYLKTIEAGFTLRHERSSELLIHLTRALQENGKTLAHTSENLSGASIVFKDAKEVWIEDDRFKISTYSKLSTLYTYTITQFDEYLDFQISETIPKKILTETEIENMALAGL